MAQSVMMTQSPPSLNNLYTLEGKLNGHRGAIACLSVIDDGGILASGGDHGKSRLCSLN